MLILLHLRPSSFTALLNEAFGGGKKVNFAADTLQRLGEKEESSV